MFTTIGIGFLLLKQAISHYFPVKKIQKKNSLQTLSSDWFPYAIFSLSFSMQLIYNLDQSRATKCLENISRYHFYRLILYLASKIWYIHILSYLLLCIDNITPYRKSKLLSHVFLEGISANMPCCTGIWTHYISSKVIA